jgi:hypothetical protein
MTLLPAAILAAVALLLAFGYWRSRAGGVRGPKVPLLQAAAEICKTARREKLALIKGLENSGEDPAEWFVSSIADVVPVCRRNAAGFEACCWGDCDAQSLYIRKRDINTYLRWARSVQ